MTMKLEPCILTGRHVQLEPFEESHIPDLWDVADHPELWAHMPFEVTDEDQLAALVLGGVELAKLGKGLGFAKRSVTDGTLVGATGLWNAEPIHRRLEIGATWITPEWQRSAINTETKFLLLRHCFETLGCIRVEFKTDPLNTRSREALARIGAREEGTLRAHMIMPDGRYRDSLYFSVLATEWAEVKQKLEGLMAR